MEFARHAHVLRVHVRHVVHLAAQPRGPAHLGALRSGLGGTRVHLWVGVREWFWGGGVSKDIWRKRSDARATKRHNAPAQTGSVWFDQPMTMGRIIPRLQAAPSSADWNAHAHYQACPAACGLAPMPASGRQLSCPSLPAPHQVLQPALLVLPAAQVQVAAVHPHCSAGQSTAGQAGVGGWLPLSCLGEWQWWYRLGGLRYPVPAVQLPGALLVRCCIRNDCTWPAVWAAQRLPSALVAAPQDQACTLRHGLSPQPRMQSTVTDNAKASGMRPMWSAPGSLRNRTGMLTVALVAALLGWLVVQTVFTALSSRLLDVAAAPLDHISPVPGVAGEQPMTSVNHAIEPGPVPGCCNCCLLAGQRQLLSRGGTECKQTKQATAASLAPVALLLWC
jgi:hypothetical protein